MINWENEPKEKKSMSIMEFWESATSTEKRRGACYRRCEFNFSTRPNHTRKVHQDISRIRTQMMIVHTNVNVDNRMKTKFINPLLRKISSKNKGACNFDEPEHGVQSCDMCPGKSVFFGVVFQICINKALCASVTRSFYISKNNAFNEISHSSVVEKTLTAFARVFTATDHNINSPSNKYQSKPRSKIRSIRIEIIKWYIPSILTLYKLSLSNSHIRFFPISINDG
uniref:Uncharacterized protein n=1 Tax=Rhizophagus irregularis (strain DAOM 181602 / DAOM 197198 / MUCL 43194) TaxID=747089 RepID=U9UAP3_RHIID